MKVLIIKLGAMGDVLRTTCILQPLKERYNANIEWAAKKESFDLLKNNKFIDKVYCREEINNKLNNKSYDWIINLDDDEEACRLASQINSKRITGAYLDNEKRIYTEDSSLWFDMGLISRFGKQKADELKRLNKKTYQEIIFSILGLENYKKYPPLLDIEEKYLDFANNFKEKNKIKNNDIVIGINTGAGGRWHDKKLSIKETRLLIDLINKKIKNSKLILFGGPEEVERNKKIIKTKIIDAGCDNSLMEFAALVNLCGVLVTSDSLALHIGVALKKKVVCFFYPTSSSEIELYGDGIKIIGKGNDYCLYKTKCGIKPKWDLNEFVESIERLTCK